MASFEDLASDVDGLLLVIGHAEAELAEPDFTMKLDLFSKLCGGDAFDEMEDLVNGAVEDLCS